VQWAEPEGHGAFDEAHSRERSVEQVRGVRSMVCRCNISGSQSRKMSPIRRDRSEGKMIGSVPQFPSIEKWQRMSENEQDALLAKMEKVRRRRSTGFRIVLGLGFAAVAVSILGALL
jgi:hypothetical protein